MRKGVFFCAALRADRSSEKESSRCHPKGGLDGIEVSPAPASGFLSKPASGSCLRSGSAKSMADPSSPSAANIWLWALSHGLESSGMSARYQGDPAARPNEDDPAGSSNSGRNWEAGAARERDTPSRSFTKTLWDMTRRPPVVVLPGRIGRRNADHRVERRASLSILCLSGNNVNRSLIAYRSQSGSSSVPLEK